LGIVAIIAAGRGAEAPAFRLPLRRTDLAHHHHQHFLMYVDACYLISHSFLLAGKGRTCGFRLYALSRATALPARRDEQRTLMGSKRTFQARLRDGLNLSRAKTAFTVPRRSYRKLAWPIFISLGGPQAHPHSGQAFREALMGNRRARRAAPTEQRPTVERATAALAGYPAAKMLRKYNYLPCTFVILTDCDPVLRWNSGVALAACWQACPQPSRRAGARFVAL